jgi:hypothetical protein
MLRLKKYCHTLDCISSFMKTMVLIGISSRCRCERLCEIENDITIFEVYQPF